MSFRFVVVEEDGDNYETLGSGERVSGNVVLGRKSEGQTYGDRTTTEGISVDEYVNLPFSAVAGNVSIENWKRTSRNHLLISDNNRDSDSEKLENNGCEQVDEENLFEVYDLNSANGTTHEGYNPANGFPVYQAGEVKIEVQPSNFYLGIEAGSTGSKSVIGTKNNIKSLEENLGKRGFETSTVEDADWKRVKSQLERMNSKTHEDATSFIMYSGHGTKNGSLALEDTQVSPQSFLDKLEDEVLGDKIVVIDQCYAGSFKDASIPNNTSVYMSSSAEKKSNGKTIVGNEKRTRYGGRIVEQLEKETGEVNLDEIHDKVISQKRVGEHDPTKIGGDIEVTEIK